MASCVPLARLDSVATVVLDSPMIVEIIELHITITQLSPAGRVPPRGHCILLYSLKVDSVVAERQRGTRGCMNPNAEPQGRESINRWRSLLSGNWQAGRTRARQEDRSRPQARVLNSWSVTEGWGDYQGGGQSKQVEVWLSQYQKARQKTTGESRQQRPAWRRVSVELENIA